MSGNTTIGEQAATNYIGSARTGSCPRNAIVIADNFFNPKAI